MKSKWLKGLLPPLVVAISLLVLNAVEALAKRELDDTNVSTTPLVRVEEALASSYQIAITAYGSVEPMEITPMSAQVSGEVVSRSEKFIDGGLVKQGELLFSIEKEAYESALIQAEANLVSAQANLIDQQAQADVAADEARRNPKKKYTDLFLRKPQVLTAKANVKSAEAALAIAKRDLNNCDVYAPFDALIVDKSLGLGQFVNTGTQVATLYNIESAKIIVPIAGFDSIFLPQDLVGASAQVRSKSLLGVTRAAEVVHDLGVVDVATRMSQLMIKVADPYGIKTSEQPLKFGTYVEVTLPGKTLDHVYKIPQELVNDRTVWVVNGESKLESRRVDIIREEGGFFFVRNGLADHDQVVTTPPEYPQQGMVVKVVSDNQVSVNTLSASH